MKGKFVDSIAFVKAWLAHRSVREVADAMGMTYAHAAVFAVKLRKEGVNLPRKNPASRSKSDVETLNAMIAEQSK